MDKLIGIDDISVQVSGTRISLLSVPVADDSNENLG